MDWKFEVIDETNGHFIVYQMKGHNELRGQYVDRVNYPKITGGTVSSNQESFSVLVSLSDGRVARFEKAYTAGGLEFVGLV